MAVRITIQAEAAQEITKQAAYYERESGSALAQRWRKEVNAAIASLRHFPLRGNPVLLSHARLSELRRLDISGFPKHHIFYRCESMDLLLVIGIIHDARHPDAILHRELT